MVNTKLFEGHKKKGLDQEHADTYVQIIAKSIGRILSEYTKLIVSPDYGNQKKTTKARTKVAKELGWIRDSVKRDFGDKTPIYKIIFQLTEEIHRIEEQFASKITYEHTRYKTKQEALRAFKEIVSEIAVLFDDTFQTKSKKMMLDESGVASAA